MIEAKIVADSIANNKRITTYVLTYPRFIHSEFMTHRMISRNASSSRAIPVSKQIKMVKENPAIPLAFTKNQKGMQGGEPLDEKAHAYALEAWLTARDRAVEQAEELADLEVHKQYANRVLEPFSHITVVATATDWDNFFALRIHPAAQPEIHALAKAMYEAREKSVPQELKAGYWHLPFVDRMAISEIKDMFEIDCLQESCLAVELAIMRSVARCARVSYLNHDGSQTTVEQDLELYKRLLGGVPIHASPAEHQAQARPWYLKWMRSGNFSGWKQYRKTLKNENIKKYETGLFSDTSKES